MKRVFISALAILLATAAVQAQTDTTKTSRREHHKMQQDGAYKQLNLSADQQAKLKTARADFKQKRDALSVQKLTEAERKTQLQALHQQHKTTVEAILTPAQKEQLAKLNQDRKANKGNRKNGNRYSSITHNRKVGANLQKQLDLTGEQQAKIKEIRTGFKTKAETLRNDQTLTKEQKQAQIHDLMQQQQAQVKTVLTKEQQEKWNALRKERAARNTK